MKLLNYFAFCFLIFFSGCENENKQKIGQPWEEYLSYEEAGFDESKLNDLSQFIKENSNTTGLIAIYKGKKVFEYGDLEHISYIASNRKSILAMLMGKYVENGIIDLNQTLEELQIDDLEGLLDIEKKATVDHLATARSGIFHDPSYGGDDRKNVLKRGSVEPGTYYLYNNWDFNAVGYIFENLVGKTIYEELEEQIAIPTGFENWDLSIQEKAGDTTKSKYLAYPINLSTKDMAKVGQLMLNNGTWNGNQLISENWLKKIVTIVTPKDTVSKRRGVSKFKTPDFGYSYMWWTFDEFDNNKIYEGSYSAHGSGGQFITVIPKLELVIAHKTDFIKKTNGKKTPRHIYYQIVDYIVNAKN